MSERMKDGAMQTFLVPLRDGQSAVVSIPFPCTSESFAALERWVAGAKPIMRGLEEHFNALAAAAPVTEGETTDE